MLSQKKYKFEKFDDNVKNKYIVYGDNLEESIQIIELLCEFNKEKIKLKSVEYKSLSEYIYVLEINGETYYFTARAYYRNGKIPDEVRKLIKEIDKPDAIIYSVDKEKVIMGFEVTSTTLAGNATWQRTGRIINFLERKIPFAFIAFFSKNDKSDKNINKKPRIPGSLFVLLFVILSLKYSTPALLGLYEHPDKSQNLDNKLLMSDWRVDIFKYLYSLIVSEESEKYLFNCFKNMKNYYFDKNKLDKTYSEFSKISLNYMEDSNFENKIILDIKNEKNTPFFSKEILNFIWKPKKISDYLNNKFKGITFFQLSKNCKAGITFETKELIDILNVGKDCYIEDFIKDINQPTVILPIKLTKMNKKKNKREFTDDPYNGEISAFTNLYAQSFPGCNIMIILLDHSNNNEYIVESAKGRKIYKSIHKYVDLVIDLDLNYFSRESENVTIEKRGKYEKEHTTEDSITSFFRTILTRENIKPSFINPPSGSWSDIKLYPTDRYYYYNRDDERGDIAFFNEVENTYYVGESKEKFGLLYKTLKKEYEKTLKLSNIIKSEIDKNSINNIQYKTFAIFKGNIDEAKIILDESLLDHVIIVDDEKEEIMLEVIDKE